MIFVGTQRFVSHIARLFGCLVLLTVSSVSAAPPTSRPVPSVVPPKHAPTLPMQETLGDPGAQLRARVVEVRLPNGMLFLLVRRPATPTFSGYLRIRVGGVDEKTGLTGIAHFFEHMAFKGTTVVGTRDWAKERKVLLALNRTGEALSRAMIQSHGKKTLLVRALERRLRSLQKKHEAYVKKEEFSRLYQAAGGTGLNATTGKDLTSYFINLPSNRLELWAHQEASRLAAPVFREYYRERDVVIEERRMAMSRGMGRLYEQFIAAAFSAHPYRFPTVGWPSDLGVLPLSEVRKFFLRYYVPSNMVGAIVGDIDIEQTKALLQRTFALIPKGETPPEVHTREPKQQGERRVQVRFDAGPSVMIGFHKPTAPHKDDYIFDVIENLLTSGRTSRLYKALVKARIAQDISASSYPGARYPNLFTFSAQPIAPHTTQDIEKVLYRELDLLKTTPVTAKELQNVKNELIMQQIKGLRSNEGLASQLTYSQAAIGDWRYFTNHYKEIEKITPYDVMRVAKTYLVESNRTVGTLVRDTTISKAPVRMRGPRSARRRRRLTHKSPAVAAAQRKRADEQMKALLASTPVPSPTLRPLPQGLRRHPSQIKAVALRFTPPKPTILRLKNGMLLYLMEDRELPLVDIFAITQTGRLYDPPGKTGLAEIVGTTLRSGGSGDLDPDALNEAVEEKAARLESSIGQETGLARLSVHRKDLLWGLQRLAAMLRTPRFAQERIDLKKAQMLEQYRRRNDNPFAIGFRQLRRAIYGKDSRWAQIADPTTLKAIQRADLIAFHKRYYVPNNIRLAIVGDFNTQAMRAALERVLGDWQPQAVEIPAIKKAPTQHAPALIYVPKPLPQSFVLIGNIGPRRHDPLAAAGEFMNHILGGGSFSSRLTTEIRSMRGWAYFAGSQLSDAKDRGLFIAYTGSKPSTTGRSLALMKQMVTQMHEKAAITPQELALTRKTLLNRYVFRFNSPAQIVYQQALFDLLGYPSDHLTRYRAELAAVTPEQIQQAAKKFIDPKRLVIVVVGWAPQFDLPLERFGKPQILQPKP